MQNITNKTVLAGMTSDELEEFITANNEPKFRAKQLQQWLYTKTPASFEQMSNLSKDFRKKLNEIATITGVKIAQKLVSKDGSIKYLIEYPDGSLVETVLMSYDNRPNLTACISAQVGCAVGCVFCATGKKGFTRNLSAKEMTEQVINIQQDTGHIVTNIVFMGQGEPLLNYDETIKAIKIFNSEFKIGMRRITVSTCGIVPSIHKLAEVNRQLILALSLHAPDHELRKQLIPIENKYPINEVMDAMKAYVKKTGRRVTIEYILVDKLNDRIEHAHKLNALLKGLKCNINLIPYNSLEGCDFKRPSTAQINKFKEILAQAGNKVVIRLEKGSDIAAACGQLTGKVDNLYLNEFCFQKKY